MHFCTTPKDDLPHYSYIFSNPEPLRTEIKNIDFYRLGTMLYLDIQKGKEATKAEKFQQHIGGTAAWKNIPMIAKKGCGQVMSNDTYFAEIWFRGVKAAD